MIKEMKLEGVEKVQFRKDYAEPLWEEFKLWTASAILDVPKDSNIYHPERWLCYVLKRIDSTPEDKYYTLLHEFWEDEEQ